ncbi:sugar porter family MFS transporter [Bosea rubneri]|uniref:Sugar porter family MFS transporter n=1 Tax=Bosea rubneri TaxID=3075434 RepID=A0ABU3SG77_9HYPH|nr:sugar porter family MFS transporter [Bosea sp. ZW T0_25]MDU0343792.1 sugar porter family MFS transporter [Bosea sp. ZW T0_25]
MIGNNWIFRSISPIQLILTLILASGIAFGFGITSVSGVLDIIKSEFELSEIGEQFVVGILVLGCFVGAAIAGPISARWGRRRTIMLAVVLGGLGYTLILAGIGFGGLLVGRSLAGLCIGLISMVVPMYAAETTPAQRRGAVVSMFQLAITLGILGAYGTTLAFAASVPWQILLGAGALPLGLGLLAILFLPESPRWLAARGEHAAVEKATLTLGLTDEWQEIPAAPAHADNQSGTALTRGSTAAVLVFCSTLFVLQNLSGIDGILYYAPRIFQELGFSAGTAALAATFGLGLVNVLATIAAIALVDRLGRRPLLIIGSAAMAIGLAAVILASQLGWPWVGLAGLAIFIAAFAMSLGPLPYVLMSELFPTAIRESGIAVASATSWLFNALIAFTFLSLVAAIGLSGAIGLFLAVCLISLGFCLAFAPETRGARLEDIETAVLAGRPLRHLGS